MHMLQEEATQHLNLQHHGEEAVEAVVDSQLEEEASPPEEEASLAEEEEEEEGDTLIM